MNFDHLSLIAWFFQEKRDLPWRQTRDPYAIWISEVMLQQTQVAVVIPYFLNWMRCFPTIRLLAQATLDEVIKAWEGLGYYSRARHLHEAAKYLVEYFDGQIPSQEAELKKIKGLGPYTIGAILSFGFHQKNAAVDGNVIRVLTRYFGIEADIAKSSTVNQLRELAQAILPDEESWIVNEALIELGATVCQRKARCHVCPMQKSCLGLKLGMVEKLPFNSKKTATEYLYRSVAVIESGASFLVKRGKKGEIMSDLYEFPYFTADKEIFVPAQVQKQIEETFGLRVVQKQILPQLSHSFTRYRVQLYPILFTCLHPKEIDGLEWLSRASLQKLAFSSGHRKIFHHISEHLPKYTQTT